MLSASLWSASWGQLTSLRRHPTPSRTQGRRFGAASGGVSGFAGVGHGVGEEREELLWRDDEPP